MEKTSLGRVVLLDAGWSDIGSWHSVWENSDKDGEGCTADKELVDADVVISQPFWPYYLTREKIESAPT